MNGEIAFEPALRERVALLKGLPISVVDDVIAKRITLTPGGPELIATMKSKGHYTALVSGGFTVFTSRIAATLGFDENRANILLEENGYLTGFVAEPILGKQAKVDALERHCHEARHFAEDAIAVGDGANDLGMLHLAGSGVALHAKPGRRRSEDPHQPRRPHRPALYPGLPEDGFRPVIILRPSACAAQLAGDAIGMFP
jgi:phosphoserine phosphatase